jgi:hypothetical protein
MSPTLSGNCSSPQALRSIPEDGRQRVLAAARAHPWRLAFSSGHCSPERSLTDSTRAASVRATIDDRVNDHLPSQCRPWR